MDEKNSYDSICGISSICVLFHEHVHIESECAPLSPVHLSINAVSVRFLTWAGWYWREPRQKYMCAVYIHIQYTVVAELV